MEEDPKKKTLICKFDFISWVVIIMHIPRCHLDYIYIYIYIYIYKAC